MATQNLGISNGVLGYLGVKPQQYQQARSLINAGVPSLNNADRLSGLTAADMAKRQAAGATGLTFLNGDALAQGTTGRQNISTPGFGTGGFGGVQSGPVVASATPTTPNVTPNTTAMVNALRQKPMRFEGLGMGLGTNAANPQATNVNLTSLGGKKTPSGLFQSI